MATFDQMDLVAYVTSNVAWMAPNFSNLNMSAVVLVFNDWFNKHGGDNASSAALATYLGTSTDLVELTYSFFGNQSVLVELLAESAEVIPILPHPKQSGAWTPLFIVLTILCTFCLILRFYSRVAVQGKIWIYDWVILAGFVVALGNALMDCIIYEMYPYRPIWDLSWPGFQSLQATALVTELLNPLALLLVKGSLLAFYHSLTTWWPLRYATYFTGFILVANMLVSVFVPIFECTPVLYWIGTSWMTGHCPVSNQNEYLVLLITGGVNIASDIFIWVMPIPLVTKLPITKREKWLSLCTFGVGIIACIASGFKLYWQKFLAVENTPYDYGSEITIWRNLEIFLGIICASVPAIRALLIQRMPSMLRGSNSDNSFGSDTRKVKSNNSDTHTGSLSTSQEKPDTMVSTSPV